MNTGTLESEVWALSSTAGAMETLDEIRASGIKAE
jgi:hypothetical protein